MKFKIQNSKFKIKECNLPSESILGKTEYDNYFLKRQNKTDSKTVRRMRRTVFFVTLQMV